MSRTAFAILAYDGVEPIDIGATFGVLSMAKRIAPDLAFFVVAERPEVEMANGLRLIAQHGLDDCPPFDVLIVLGGPGWEAACGSAAVLDFVRRAAAGTVASVCTGAMILGAAGLLDGRRATTKREVLPGERRPVDLLAERCPKTRVVPARIVDEGAVLTGGGVTLGIDMTLHLLSRFCGARVAYETARVLEYADAREVNRARMPDFLPRPHGV